MFKQRTLKKAISCTGLGLHTGRKVNLTISPAEPDHGITFIRKDVRPWIEIEARVENVVDTRLATTLGKRGIRISTVEHLLSSLYGLGIDNAIVEVDGPEIPILDGSAAPFVYLLQNAGIVEQERAKRFMVVRRKVEISHGESRIVVLPDHFFRISFTIDFDHSFLKTQSFSFINDARTFQREISKARTFGFLKEVELLRSMGLARGGSLENAIVIDDYRILNEEGLRYPDEFVRHKILDLLGDLSLLGAYLIGHVKAYRSGHHLNYKAVHALLNSRETDLVVPNLREADKTPEPKIRKAPLHI